MHGVVHLALAGSLVTGLCGCASAPMTAAEGVVLSQAATIRDEAWPTHLEAIVLTVDGRERTDPLAAVRVVGRDGGPTRITYRASDDEPILEVEEVSELGGVGADCIWRRTFVVRGLASGRELALLVPVETPAGVPLAVAVHGAPLVAAFGAAEHRVPLARDEATRLEIRWRRLSER